MVGRLTETSVPQKSPSPIDKHVGSRVRVRRLSVGMSQSRLAAALGLTFQQVQKYEKGMNRISASRLLEIGRLLEAPVAYFFEGAPGSAVEIVGFAEGGEPNSLLEFGNTREGLELNRAFVRIGDARVRRSVLDLVRALADRG
jgi:transcriptional regulator with XRE-family HTH domain